MKKPVTLIIITIALLACITLTKNRLTAIRGSAPPLESMAYLPGSERVKPFMLGFNTTYAHYLWIRTVIYSGGQFMGDRQFDWLVEMIDMITRLHPHFNEAYEFAGLMIPGMSNNPGAAKVILERGMNVFGKSKWNVPFYLAMVYHRYYQDPDRAAENFAIAAQAPGNHQGRLASLAATFYNNAGRDTEALDILLFLYETSENPEVKRHIEERIERHLEEMAGDGV
ncbi:MAG: hypothetical protein LBC70_03450 [Chitinispirillales bacterium]|jgi:hypothetical protein|nr:hypothetical protein [Chitinispirillales bacterium]